MLITEYTNMHDSVGTQFDMSWDQFIGFATAHSIETIRENKQDCPMIGGHFNGRKIKANWIGQDWIGLDIDHNASLEVLFPFLIDLNWSCVVYTTFNHTPSHPKLRIIFPLDRIVDGADTFEQCWLGINEIFRIEDQYILDQACKNSNRGFFLPVSRPGGWVERIDGESFAPVSELISRAPSTRGPSPEMLDFQQKLAAYRQDYPDPNRKKPAPGYHNHLYDSNILKKERLEEYFNAPQGSHHIAFHGLLCSIAAMAKIRNYPLTPYELATIASQIDQADIGGPYYNQHQYQLKAIDAIKKAG